jgi:hypothetical protein
VRTLPCRGQLGDDDLVHQRDIRRHVEDLGGQLGSALGPALGGMDLDGTRVWLCV